MKKLLLIVGLLTSGVLTATIWDDRASAEFIHDTYYPGRPVRTAVVGAVDTVDTAAENTANVFRSDRPVRTAVEGAVDTADTAVENAANVVRSIFN